MDIFDTTCPGYHRIEAPQGRCLCGLHWTDYMPLHDTKGRPFSDRAINRSLARQARMTAAELARDRARREMGYGS